MNRTPLVGHVDSETAYVVDDYPYGSLRTQMRYWIESSSRGMRYVRQSLNPKTNRWNKPHTSTYAPYVLLYINNENGHCEHLQLGHIGYGVTDEFNEIYTEFYLSLDDFNRDKLNDIGRSICSQWHRSKFTSTATAEHIAPPYIEVDLDFIFEEGVGIIRELYASPNPPDLDRNDATLPIVSAKDFHPTHGYMLNLISDYAMRNYVDQDLARKIAFLAPEEFEEAHWCRSVLKGYRSFQHNGRQIYDLVCQWRMAVKDKRQTELILLEKEINGAAQAYRAAKLNQTMEVTMATTKTAKSTPIEPPSWMVDLLVLINSRLKQPGFWDKPAMVDMTIEDLASQIDQHYPDYDSLAIAKSIIRELKGKTISKSDFLRFPEFDITKFFKEDKPMPVSNKSAATIEDEDEDNEEFLDDPEDENYDDEDDELEIDEAYESGEPDLQEVDANLAESWDDDEIEDSADEDETTETEDEYEDQDEDQEDELVATLSSILKLVADSPEKLRAADVDRVMAEAYNMECLDDFKSWLLSHELKPMPRKAVVEWEPSEDSEPEEEEIDVKVKPSSKPKQQQQPAQQFNVELIANDISLVLQGYNACPEAARVAIADTFKTAIDALLAKYGLKKAVRSALIDDIFSDSDASVQVLVEKHLAPKVEEYYHLKKLDDDQTAFLIELLYETHPDLVDTYFEVRKASKKPAGGVRRSSGSRAVKPKLTQDEQIKANAEKWVELEGVYERCLAVGSTQVARELTAAGRSVGATTIAQQKIGTKYILDSPQIKQWFDEGLITWSDVFRCRGTVEAAVEMLQPRMQQRLEAYQSA